MAAKAPKKASVPKAKKKAPSKARRPAQFDPGPCPAGVDQEDWNNPKWHK